MKSAAPAKSSQTKKRTRDGELCINPNHKILRALCASHSRQSTKKKQGSIEAMEEEPHCFQQSRPISSFLDKILSEERENSKGGHRFLIIVVHAAMLELGFVGFDVGSSSACLGFRLPRDWATKESIFTRYTLPQFLVNNENDIHVENIELQFQLMGKSLGVYGSLSNARDSQHCLQYSEFSSSMELFSYSVEGNRHYRVSPRIRETLAQNRLGNKRVLLQIWRAVNYGLCLPLLTCLCEKTGLPLPPSLISLPMELQMKIFKALADIDLGRVGCVCTRFRNLANELWKQKYIDEFGCMPSNGYKSVGARSWSDAYSSKMMTLHELLMDVSELS